MQWDDCILHGIRSQDFVLLQHRQCFGSLYSFPWIHSFLSVLILLLVVSLSLLSPVLVCLACFRTAKDSVIIPNNSAWFSSLESSIVFVKHLSRWCASWFCLQSQSLYIRKRHDGNGKTGEIGLFAWEKLSRLLRPYSTVDVGILPVSHAILPRLKLIVVAAVASAGGLGGYGEWGKKWYIFVPGILWILLPFGMNVATLRSRHSPFFFHIICILSSNCHLEREENLQLTFQLAGLILFWFFVSIFPRPLIEW